MLQDLPTSQLQPGLSFLHLTLLPNLLVQPKRMPGTQASSAVTYQCPSSPARWWWEKGAPEGLKHMVRFPQEGMDIKHAAE